jgi:hypothetical protein
MYSSEETTSAGVLIEESWRRERFDPEAFPEIASKAVEPFEAPDIGEVIEKRRDSIDSSYKFSDLDLILYKTPRFSIDLLLWLDGTTAIHQHGFCGAFKLLSGSSLHVTYEFSQARSISDSLRVGRLIPSVHEIMRRGEVRKIAAGDQFIHANMHLERPTITLVVRTVERSLGGPQFNYHRPYLAMCDGSKDLATRTQRLLEFAFRSGGDAECERVARTLLSESTPDDALIVLMNARILLGDPQRLTRLLDAAFYRVDGKAIRETIWQQRWNRLGLKWVRGASDPRHKLIGALLLSGLGRTEILLRLMEEFGEDRFDLAAHVVRMLLNTTRRVVIPRADEPSLAQCIALGEMPADPAVRQTLMSTPAGQIWREIELTYLAFSNDDTSRKKG